MTAIVINLVTCKGPAVSELLFNELYSEVHFVEHLSRT